jgi:hypothetical protein
MGHIFPHSSRERRLGKKLACLEYCRFDTVSSLAIVSGYKTPDFEEIAHSLRRELVTAHPSFCSPGFCSPSRALLEFAES